jgi:stage II sporulation protein AA (anti-sigma F factor antagonist)
MDITVAQRDQATVVSVVGSVDALTVDTLTEALKKQFEQGNLMLVADLNDVDYMSSAGIRALLNMVKESRGLGGDLLLAAARGGAHRVLEMSGFMNIAKIFSDVDAALASLDT